MKLSTTENGFAHLVLFIGIAFALLFGVIGVTYVRMSSAAETEINAATYNLRSQRWDGESPKYASWSARKSLVAATINKPKPGIIGMQEVIARDPGTGKTSLQRRDVVKLMGDMGYSGYTGSGNNSSPLFWRSSNFTKLESNETELFSFKGDRAPRFLTYAKLKQVHTGKQVIVLNYHFNQFEEHANQLALLGKRIAYLKKTNPAVDIFFVGDFNGFQNKVIASAKANGVTLRIADGHVGIDHVLVTPKVKVRGYNVVEPGKPPATDHPLVIARLII